MKGFYYALCLFFSQPDFNFVGLNIHIQKFFSASRNAAYPAFSYPVSPVNSNTWYSSLCLQFMRATSQEWLAGVRGGGRGIKYDVRVKITTDKKVAFDSMWVSGKKLSIKVAELLKDPEFRFSNNYEISLVASFYLEPSNKNQGKEEYKSISTSDTIKAPLEYKGAALIKYSVADSIKYLEVPFFTVLPKLVGQ